jgi:multimeric flavodoxin WrbA
MKFLIFNGSLKADAESNTYAVCEMTKLAFEKLGHECEIVTMRELDYEGSTSDVNDELKPHIMKMFNMDGVIFATPIWWGQHSCHIQAMLERLDAIYSWAKDNKYQPFYNKVFGTLISGGGDGFQHIHGVLYSAASNFGFTIPPQCNIESKAQGMDEIVKDDDTVNQVKNCVINMTTWARILKEGNPTKDARHGSVDINEEAAGVGIVTKQNATKDVPVGGEYMNVKKLKLAKENFADGKKKGKSRPGRVKRAGASCKGSVTSLRSKAKKASGERAKMYHWCANMKSGRKKK